MHSTTVDKKKCEGFEDEISGLEHVCGLEYHEIKAVVRQIRKNRREAEKLKAKLALSKEDPAFLEKMDGFHDLENVRLKKLEEDATTGWQDYSDLRKYFHEPEMKTNEFFKTFVDFLEDYQRCKSEMEEKKLRAERRKKEIEMKRSFELAVTLFHIQTGEPRHRLHLDEGDPTQPGGALQGILQMPKQRISEVF